MRATRDRQLATPSWLSTRPPAGHPTVRCARSRYARDSYQNSDINLELATATGSSPFSRVKAGRKVAHLRRLKSGPPAACPSRLNAAAVCAAGESVLVSGGE